MPLLFLHLFLETLGVLLPLPGEGQDFETLTLINSAPSSEPLLPCTRTMEADYRSGLAASDDENHIYGLLCSFLPPLHPPRSRWPRSHEPVVVSQKVFPPEEGAVPEAGRKEKGGVYRPEDVFQLLLLTPFQSKLSGLFQGTSGQSAVGFACPLGVEAKTASPWVRGEEGIIYNTQ